MRAAALAVALLSVLAAVRGHIALISPCPRYSGNGQNCPALPAGQNIDYDLTSPVGTFGSTKALPLCHHDVPWPTPAATWTAGQSVTVTFMPGGATHNGGHCEFSVSYDGGKTFVVVYQVLRYCFYSGPPSSGGQAVRSYTFTLPKDLPGSTKAIFAWSWVNASGNREFYMNCADVSITGTSTSFSGKNITIANYPGYSQIPEFGTNYDTGIDMYTTKATKITVSANGPSKPASSGTDPANNEDSGGNGGNGSNGNNGNNGNNRNNGGSESSSSDTASTPTGNDDKCSDDSLAGSPTDTTSESSSSSTSESSSNTTSSSSGSTSESSSNSTSESSSDITSESSSSESSSGGSSSEESSSGEESSSQESRFAMPVMPHAEPAPTCDTSISVNQAVNVYANLFASYGYLTAVAPTSTESEAGRPGAGGPTPTGNSGGVQLKH